MVNVTIIETSGLGDRSYLISDGEVAVSVDPQRDIDRVLELTGGLRITHVLETHIHSDYVTGGLALAKEPAPNASFPQGKTSTLTAERLRMATGSTPTNSSRSVAHPRTYPPSRQLSAAWRFRGHRRRLHGRVAAKLDAETVLSQLGSH